MSENPKKLRKLDIFISSPGDVQEEREIAIKVIHRLNSLPQITRRFVLKPLAYEKLVPPAIGQSPANTIDRYMMEAGNADIYICILWHRWGTPVIDDKGKEYESGTMYEFENAYRANLEKRKPRMLLYRCLKQAPLNADTEQIRHVDNFFSRFIGKKADLKGLYGEFKSNDEFEQLFFDHLNTVIATDFDKPEEEPLHKRRDFYQHISLPANYVGREELLVELREAILEDRRNVALTSAIKAKPTALHGMGGIGKSVMARALCEDPRAQAAFPDGILWATLGKEPNVAEQMRQWIIELGGTIPETAPTLEQLKANLAKLLATRACLLIVDDVWQRQHAEAFRVGGPQCRLVITTRDAEVAAELNAKVLPVPLMTRDQAVLLLEEWADEKLYDIDRVLKERIVERLGRLPLALKLAGAQLRHKDVESWLASFDARKLKSKRSEDIHDSLEATFELSLEELGEHRRLYIALAIFKEDEAIPEAVLQKLWQTLANFDDETTADFLDDLIARALLNLEKKEPPRSITIHDLVRDLIAAELGIVGNKNAHAALLETYRSTCTGEGWHTAPDDGYLYDHLVYHLENIQHWDELHALFKDQNWMHVRVPQCDYDYDGYLSDLMVASQETHQCAKAQIAAHEMPTALAACVRYALIRTSVNSLAANYELVLVARAVEIGLWSAQRALSLAAKVPSPVQRANFFVKLLTSARIDHEPRALAQREGLAAARMIEDEEERAQVLLALVQLLTGKERERVLREGLATARAIEVEEKRAQVLLALVQLLTGKEREQVLREGLAAARTIEDEEKRAQVLLAGALKLTGEERAQVLGARALQLTGEEREQGLRESLAAAWAIKDERSRADVLRELSLQLTGEERKQVLRESLAAAWAIQKEWLRVHMLGQLALQLTGEEHE